MINSQPQTHQLTPKHDTNYQLALQKDYSNKFQNEYEQYLYQHRPQHYQIQPSVSSFNPKNTSCLKLQSCYNSHQFHFYWKDKKHHNQVLLATIDSSAESTIQQCMDQAIQQFNQQIQTRHTDILSYQIDSSEMIVYQANKLGEPKMDYGCFDLHQKIALTNINRFVLVAKQTINYTESEDDFNKYLKSKESYEDSSRQSPTINTPNPKYKSSSISCLFLFFKCLK